LKTLRHCVLCGTIGLTSLCDACRAERKRDQSNPPKTFDKPSQAVIDTPEVQCKNRSDAIGKLKCGCQGKPKLYRCGTFIRPDINPVQQAFCTTKRISKPMATAVAYDKTVIEQNIMVREILFCSVSCECFEAKP